MSFEERGVHLPKGFHAVEDANKTRAEVFSTIGAHQPARFDSTYLTKAKAYGYVKARGKPYLYQMAIYQHLKHLIPDIATDKGDRVHVIAATIHLTKGNLAAARTAVGSVCQQLSGPHRTVVPCLWEARSSWGIQVADYCAWALQREMEEKPCQWYPTVVEPLLVSNYGPWD